MSVLQQIDVILWTSNVLAILVFAFTNLNYLWVLKILLRLYFGGKKSKSRAQMDERRKRKAWI